METFPCPTIQGSLPYLEHFPEPGGALQRVRLSRSPFRLGRDASADLVVYCARVSKAHAEIVLDREDLFLRDLGSTNGTFVNGRRIQDRVALVNGDIIHLAEKEFRFGCEPIEGRRFDQQNSLTESAHQLTGLRSLIQDRNSLHELIERQQVLAHFQPIVRLADRQVVAYEALGRGAHQSLPVSPGPLFVLAEKLQLAAPLSRAFRRLALAEAACFPRPHSLFLNMHSHELPEEALLRSLDELPCPMPPDQTVVLEIHEDYAAEVDTLERLRARLRERNVGLAFDDFGAGQSRLAVLAQVPADYVKLDRGIVQALPHSAAMRELMRAVAQVCAGLGTVLLAEGLETEEEAAIALELGCPLGQGFLFGHPRPASELSEDRG
jgi:EAL domain-containing protein (putative c-di-GMP-specific phosphodiesterase class I)